ncbi:hypothetical protein HELRODRAFT_184250 [Helobdella robusta]|uniref:Uncharacterized protein n=1 Tax=Helobdella robusta TaxID=6412 RepID=T1FKU8_HELRO|nr:hypothetical protein HELRODRAFT_184250 [Helobdella robusta]ESO04145.1 hypothetical protein HELRODRAFT_184250 [Helobdella robusta]
MTAKIDPQIAESRERRAELRAANGIIQPTFERISSSEETVETAIPETATQELAIILLAYLPTDDVDNYDARDYYDARVNCDARYICNAPDNCDARDNYDRPKQEHTNEMKEREDENDIRVKQIQVKTEEKEKQSKNSYTVSLENGEFIARINDVVYLVRERGKPRIKIKIVLRIRRSAQRRELTKSRTIFGLSGGQCHSREVEVETNKAEKDYNRKEKDGTKLSDNS